MAGTLMRLLIRDDLERLTRLSLEDVAANHRATKGQESLVEVYLVFEANA
jgi:hypothetical protein